MNEQKPINPTLMEQSLRFLSDEWQQLADELLAKAKTKSSIDRGQALIGRSEAYYQAATALQVLLNMVQMQPEENGLSPISLARATVNMTAKKE